MSERSFTKKKMLFFPGYIRRRGWSLLDKIYAENVAIELFKHVFPWFVSVNILLCKRPAYLPYLRILFRFNDVIVFSLF